MLVTAAAFAFSTNIARVALAQDAPRTTPSKDTPPPVDTSKTPETPAPRSIPERDRSKPPPLHVEYAQLGVAITAEINVGSGATCPLPDATHPRAAPCILGSGGGLAIRGGYRTPGPWYYGGAYEFAKMDSSNLYRLGILQQLRAEMRYAPDFGTRAEPFATWGVGALLYGNEWGVDTAGALAFIGAGVSLEVSRLALIGAAFSYKPMLIAGWTDTAGTDRATGLAHFFSIEFDFELRTELGRR